MGKFNKQNAAKDNLPNKLRVTFTAPYMGLPKWGRAETVFQLFVFQLASYPLDVINLAIRISSTFIYKFNFS